MKGSLSGGFGPCFGFGGVAGGAPAEGVAENGRGVVPGGCSEGEASPL